MLNLLEIPFKKTCPVNIKDPVKTYLHDYSGVHPDHFARDIELWQKLRETGWGGTVTVEGIDSVIFYLSQIFYVLKKFPSDFGLSIAYAPAFEPEGTPVTLKSLAFERCAVLFNLAALYSQLAAGEDRSKINGIKRATTNYQCAAGVLSFLADFALPKLDFSTDKMKIPIDLRPAFIKSLEWLMLAQAQECSWQLAKLNQYGNALIAKIATRVSTLYQLASGTIYKACIMSMFPEVWLPHMNAKESHFAAVAQYRQSVNDVECSRYGVEISRLRLAEMYAKRALEIAEGGRVSKCVILDAQSLIHVLQINLSRAHLDNDLIYRHDIPSQSSLPAIANTNLVAPTIPTGLSDPMTVLSNRYILFSELISWGAREAINIYHDRKENLIKEKLENVFFRLKEASRRTLHLLNLPSALESLEEADGLPSRLCKRAEEVRLENGPMKIEKSLDFLENLRQKDLVILNEAMDILDNEASEDEESRKFTELDRSPSHMANTGLVEKEQRYRDILNEAAVSDELLRQKWDQWGEGISELTWSEDDLSVAIPSFNSLPISSQDKQTRLLVRALRALIEELDDLHLSAEQILDRARKRAAADEIRNLVLQAASSLKQLTENEPAAFENVLDEELAKYDLLLQEMKYVEKKQADILTNIQLHNEQFLHSRKGDLALDKRQYAIQSLELAYHKYREILGDLDEGFKFYNDLATILLQFKENCKAWRYFRSQEIQMVS